MSLQPYQQRVPIGTTASGEPVTASVELVRYISMWVYERIGGADALSNRELEELIGTSALQMPAMPDVVLPDVVQPAAMQMQYADIVQPGQADCVSEMTMQC